MSFLYAITIYLLFVHQIRADFELLILHNNDLRGRIEEYIDHSGSRYGGFARIAQVVKEAREAASQHTGPPVLYLNAGDIYAGSIWETNIDSALMVEFLNILQPNASGFGEHDLDQIDRYLHPFVQKIKYPLVVANIHFRKNAYLANVLKPSVVFKLTNKRVGVIGYVSSSQFYRSLTDGQIYLEDEVAAVYRESKKLKNEGVDVIIALGYSGYSIDKKIAFQVKNVDVVVGGMSNTLLWNGEEPNTEEVEGSYPTVVVQPSGKRVPVVQTYGFAKYIGNLTLKFDDSNNLLSYDGNAIFLDMKISPDLVTSKILSSQASTLGWTSDTLFKSMIPLSAENSSISESNLANFVTDCILEYAASTNKLKSSALVLLNAGAFKGKVPTSKESPNVTISTLEEVTPFYDMLLVFDVPGAYLIKTLEINMNNLENHGMLRSAGLHFYYDFSGNGTITMQDLRVICIDCEEPTYHGFYENYIYTIITTENAIQRFEGFEILRREMLDKRSLHASVANALVWKARLTPIIFSELDDRSQVTEMLEEVAPCYHKLSQVAIQGKYIFQAIENGITNFKDRQFIHGSGLRYDFDLSRPANKKLIDVRVNCYKDSQPSYCKLNLEKYYRFTTTGYFLKRSGHDILRYQGSTMSFDDDVMQAIKYTVGLYGITRPETDNRIVKIGKPGSRSSSIIALRSCNAFVVCIFISATYFV